MNRALPLLLALVTALALAGCATDPATQGLTTEDRQKAAQANTQLGVQYLRRGELQQALGKLRKAVRQDPKSSDARMMLGVVYQRLDEPELAEDALSEAVSLDPENSRAKNNYGRFLCERGDFERARRLFEQSAANPAYERPAVPLTNAGICALRAGDKEAAEDFLLRALESNPRQPAALLRMARLRFEAGHALSARGYYQRYLAAARQTAESAWLGLRIENELGDEDAVASYRQLLMGQFPDSEQTRKLLEWEKNDRL